MPESSSFEKEKLPLVDRVTLQSIFENHRILDDLDRDAFTRLECILHPDHDVTADELIELDDIVSYFRERQHAEITRSKTRFEPAVDFQLTKLLQNAKNAIWNTLKTLRPLEAAEIHGTPADESFADAYTAHASIIKSTESILRELREIETGRNALQKALKRKKLSTDARRSLETYTNQSQDTIKSLSTILAKRPNEHR